MNEANEIAESGAPDLRSRKVRSDKGKKRGPYGRRMTPTMPRGGGRRVDIARKKVAALRAEVKRLKALLAQRPAPVPAAAAPQVPEGTVAIPLTHGLFATIDAADTALVAGARWHAWTRKNLPGAAYAARRVQGRTEWMHRLILGAGPGDSVDHSDGDGLNNRRGNLRFATAAQNQRNRLTCVRNQTGFRGVNLHRQSGLYFVHRGTQRRYFHNDVAGAIAYDEAILAQNDPFRPINGVRPEHRARATRCLLSEAEAAAALKRYVPEPHPQQDRSCGCAHMGRHRANCPGTTTATEAA